MKSEIRSSDVPDVSGLVKREIAYNKRVNPIEEMRYRINKYQASNSSFNVRVVDSDSTIKIRFTSDKNKNSVKLQKKLKNETVHNSAFGDYKYNLELLSVSLKNRRQQTGEYLEMVYWGSVNNTGVEEFVEENARVVKREINLENDSNNNRFICTDVNAYTERKEPNPWCRKCILLLYENQEMFEKLRDHPELGVRKKVFSKIYKNDILEPNRLN